MKALFARVTLKICTRPLDYGSAISSGSSGMLPTAFYRIDWDGAHEEE